MTSRALLFVCDDRAEFDLCQTLLTASDLDLTFHRVSGAVALAEAVAAGPFDAIVIDVALRFAPAAEVTPLLLRSFDAPLLALGGRLAGSSAELPRGAAGYLELPKILRRFLEQPQASQPSVDHLSRIAQVLGLAYARVSADARLIESNPALEELVGDMARRDLSSALLASLGSRRDADACSDLVLGDRSVSGAHVRAGDEHHFLLDARPTAAAEAHPSTPMASPPDKLHRNLQRIGHYADLLGAGLETTGTPELREVVANLIDVTARTSALVEAHASDPQRESSNAGVALTAATGELGPLLTETQVTVQTDELPKVNMSEASLTTIFKGLLQHTISHRAAPSVKVRVSAEMREDDWLLKLQTPDAKLPPLDESPPANSPSAASLRECRELVEQHGGELWSGQSEEGSELLFSIPGHPELVPRAGVPRPDQGSARPSWGKSAVVIHSASPPTGEASITSAKEAVTAAAAVSRASLTGSDSRSRNYVITQAFTGGAGTAPVGVATTEVWDGRGESDHEAWQTVRGSLSSEEPPSDDAPQDTLEDDWAALVDGLGPRPA